MLSGTLNYIFSTYDGGAAVTFADTVRQAVAAGYAEPDPRIDLSGRDVLRKLLILAREAGLPLEEEDVAVEPLLPAEYFEGGTDDFYRRLQEHEPELAARYRDAAEKGLRRRVVASLEHCTDAATGYRASIVLKEVGEDHPLFNLSGTDNAVLLETDFYPSPLVIQGAGAGAYQTASGILNDILTYEKKLQIRDPAGQGGTGD